MYQFKLPDLGEGIAEAELVEWHVQEGDTVAEDQLMVEVITDKAAIEIPSPRAGRVHRLYGKEGDIIPVGDVLIEIDEAHEALSGKLRIGVDAPSAKTALGESTKMQEEAIKQSGNPQSIGEPAPPASAAQKPPVISEGAEESKHPPHMPPRPHAHSTSAVPEQRKPVDAVPAVRERAKQLGVDIEQVSGTGPGGRVMRRDVEGFYGVMKKGEPLPTTPRVLPEEPRSKIEDESDWTRQPLRRLRRRIAERMVLSTTLIPHYTYVEEIDTTVLEDKRKILTETTEGEKISPLAFIAHAVVRVLPHYPQMNACMDEETEEIIYKGKIHLGIAVTTEAGLVVPVIRDAAAQDVVELAATIRDLSGRARKKRLKPSELQGSTITITSLGKLGGIMATPIINYPASAIIGVHAIRTLPRYVDDQVEPRKIMNLSVSLDHRIVDGFEGARFIQDVREILEQADFPEFK